jgi:hypothetical protein
MAGENVVMSNQVRRASAPLPKFTEKAISNIEKAAKQKLRKLVRKDSDSYNGSKKEALKQIDSWHFDPHDKKGYRAGEKDTDLVIDTGIGVDTVVSVKNGAVAGKDGVVHWKDVKGVEAMNLYDSSGI